MNLIKYIPKHIRPTLTLQLDVMRSLQISREDLGVIMGHLKHTPQMWGHISQSHPQYQKTLKDIQILLPEIRFNHPTFVVHFESGWLLAVTENVMIPAVFQMNQGEREGLSITLYRVIIGAACIWLENAPEYIRAIAPPQEVTMTVDRKNPYVVLDLG